MKHLLGIWRYLSFSLFGMAATAVAGWLIVWMRAFNGAVVVVTLAAVVLLAAFIKHLFTRPSEESAVAVERQRDRQMVQLAAAGATAGVLHVSSSGAAPDTHPQPAFPLAAAPPPLSPRPHRPEGKSRPSQAATV